MFPLPIIWTVDLGYDSLLVLATGFCWLLVCWLSFYIAFWVLIEICWQSTSSYFLERVKCAHGTPQIKVDLFSVLTATFMKSCHHHLFNLCTIQRYLTVVTAKVLAHALVIPWLYHLETPGCPSHFSARTGLPKHYVLFQGFFFFQFLCKFHVNLLFGQLHCFSLSEDYYYFFKGPTCWKLTISGLSHFR